MTAASTKSLLSIMIEVVFDTTKEWGSYLIILPLPLVMLAFYRKFASSIFDPWFPLLFNQVVYAILIGILYIQAEINSAEYVYWNMLSFAFMLPFLIGKNRSYSAASRVNLFSSAVGHFSVVSVKYLIFYQLLSDFIFVINRGIPVFYEYGSDPQIYIDGFGFVKYIHDAMRYILPPLSIVAYYHNSRGRLLFFSIVMCIYPALLFEWSKVGLITIFANYYFSYLIIFGRTKLLIKYTRRAFVLSLLFVMFMFSLAAARGYGGNGFEAFLIRIVQTIDSAYLYFVLGGNQFVPSDFSFTGYFFSLISPYFGYDSKANNIGHVLLSSAGMNTESGYGPSPPFQIVSHIFFGYYGVFYAFLIGIILVLVRSRLYRSGNVSLISFLIIYSFLHVLAGDASLLLYYTFTFLLLIPPIFCAFITSYFVRDRVTLSPLI